ncbi:MAG TPA: preprotein translocase subunit SecE [Tepidisphaeraceae bacterium]|nr:preprotein translocase subunit SecE [Tepidisphaeraceae bacterium]
MDKKNQDDENEPDGDSDESAGRDGGGEGDKTPARQGQPQRRPGPPPSASASSEPGFFHIYKKGQGKWTRVGTVFGAAIIGAMTAAFVYNQTSYVTIRKFQLGYIPCFVFCAVYALLAYLLMNNRRNVDFLIATDSEMKKVNWTTRAELWGSTKVIILFMFVVAIFLFIVDLFFGYLFYWLHVLRFAPGQGS